jgi:cysteine synthase
MSQEKVRLLKAFGAQVIVTPTAVPPDHPDNYVMMAKRIAEETPNAILANQFYNQANPEAHYRTTGPELWEQTEGRITHFVAAAGTGGTITGVGRYLKERNPACASSAATRWAPSSAEYAETGERRVRPVQGGGDRAGQDPRHAGHGRGGRVALRGRPHGHRTWPAASRARRGSSWAARRG